MTCVRKWALAAAACMACFWPGALRAEYRVVSRLEAVRPKPLADEQSAPQHNELAALAAASGQQKSAVSQATQTLPVPERYSGASWAASAPAGQPSLTPQANTALPTPERYAAAESAAWLPMEGPLSGRPTDPTPAGFTRFDAVRLAAAQETPAGEPLPGLPAPSAPPSGAPTADGSTIIYEDGSSELWTDVWGTCHACCQAGFVGGVEGLFLAPVGEPDQTVLITDLVTGRAYEGESHAGFGMGLRTWAGLQRKGWGFRFQYMHFGNEEIEPNPDVPLEKTPAFEEAFHLQADAIDIELTQGMCFGCWKIDTSFGGRYARLERNATVVGYGTVGNGVNLFGLAMGSNELEGPGFTFSIGGRKPFRCGWNVFWRYRGSLLWADTSAVAVTEANAVTKDPIGAANSRDRASACGEDSENLYISELSLGVEYERCLRCCPSVLFLRAAFEYQHWVTGDEVAETDSYAFLQGSLNDVPFGGRVDAFSYAHDGDLDLIGFMLGAGLTY